MTPELRLLRALDELRDAMADVFVTRSEPAPPPATMTMTAAALRLGVARSTVTRWADSGRLHTVGPVHARRVPASSIHDYISAGARDVAPAAAMKPAKPRPRDRETRRPGGAAAGPDAA